jgi:hypothetical protein
VGEDNKTIQEWLTQPANQSRNNLTDYIRSKNDSWEKSTGIYPHKSYFVFSNIAIFVQDPIPSEIGLNAVLQTVENSLPKKFVENTGVEMILIGQFQELIDREIQSLWKASEGTIYVTSDQDSAEDMIDDLIHEFAHATEDKFGFELYSDDQIEKEFLQKRRYLHDILSAHGHRVSLSPYLELTYNKEFDSFLYKEVGYEKLTFLTAGLFPSPYAATSLREYFATGFEEYFLPNGDRGSLQQMSPALYNKLTLLSEY